MITVSDCRHLVGEWYRIPKAVMIGPDRRRKYARPRQMAMVLAREATGASLPRIGTHFGGRDHTTVIHARRRIKELEGKSEKLRLAMENFRLIMLTYKFQQEARY